MIGAHQKICKCVSHHHLTLPNDMKLPRLPSMQVNSTETATPTDSTNTITWHHSSCDNDWDSPGGLQVYFAPPYEQKYL